MNNPQSKTSVNGDDNAGQPLRITTSRAKGLAQQLSVTQNKLSQLNQVQSTLDGFVNLKKQFLDAQQVTKALALQLKNVENPSQQLQYDFNLAREETKRLKEELNPLRVELQQSGVSTKNLTKHQLSLKNQINLTNKDIEKQCEQLTALSTRQQKHDQIKSRYDIGMQRVDKIGQLGKNALSKGQAAGQTLQKVLGPGYQFDDKMNQTQSTLGIKDKRDPKMLALKEQAKSLSLSSKFSSSDIAQGQNALAQQGFDAKQIAKLMPDMVNLATASHQDLPSAINMGIKSKAGSSVKGGKTVNSGNTAQLAKQNLDNLGGDLSMLNAAFDNISIELFEANEQGLRAATQGLTRFINVIGQFLKEHPALSQTIVMFGGIFSVASTVFGGLASLLSGVATPILMIQFLLAKMGISLGGIFSQTGSASSGIAEFAKKLIAFTGSSFINVIKTLGDGLVTLASSPIKLAGAAFEWLGGALMNLARLAMANPIGLVIMAIGLAAGLIYKYWQPISDFFSGFWQGLTTAIAPVIESFSFLAPIFNAIGDAIGAVINWFSELFTPIESTSEGFDGAKSAGLTFGTAIGDSVNFIIGLFDSFFELLGKVWDFILSLPTKIADLPGKICAIFTGENGLFSSFTNIGTNMIDGLIGGIKEKWNDIKQTISSLTDGVTGWFKSALGIHSPSRVFADYGGYTIEGYQVGIENNQNDALRTMHDFADKVNSSGAYIDQIGGTSAYKAQHQGQSQSRISQGSSQYYITVNANPGMDEQMLASKIAEQLEKREWQQATRFSSSLRDID